MQETMPQEIEIRYILPAIRRELARVFIEEHGLSQKGAADLLGLTESAVSQYRHSKRAKEVVFSNSIVNDVRMAAKKIVAEKANKQILIGEMYRISSLATVRHIVCSIHKSQSKDLERCNVCFDKGLTAIRKQPK